MIRNSPPLLLNYRTAISPPSALAQWTEHRNACTETAPRFFCAAVAACFIVQRSGLSGQVPHAGQVSGSGKLLAPVHTCGPPPILAGSRELGSNPPGKKRALLRSDRFGVSIRGDADETSDTQPSKFPKTDVLSHIEVADGRIWLLQEGIESFAGDLSEQEKKLVWATQCVPAPDLFAAKAGGTAWRSKPSWYIVATNDRTIQPDCERFLAKRMGATTTEVASSHVVMLAQPQVVIDVIRKAVKAAPGVTAAA